MRGGMGGEFGLVLLKGLEIEASLICQEASKARWCTKKDTISTQRLRALIIVLMTYWRHPHKEHADMIYSKRAMQDVACLARCYGLCLGQYFLVGHIPKLWRGA